MKTDRKPPLAKSPMRLRGRRVLRPPNTNTPLRTPDEEPKTAYNLGVKVDFTKKKDYKKKTESLKKSMMAAANYSADRSQHPRYSLRSTAKKPPLPVPMYVDEKTTTARKAPGTRARRCR
ncbi:Neuronal acetylcholine receptor subunit beta-4 [Bienertia sinuspersici]